MTDSTLPLSVPLPAVLRDAIEQYDHWAQAHLLEQQEQDTVTQPLYQYTNAAGLVGIFESNHLWFTDYRYLNDPSEIYYGMGIVRDTLREAKAGVGHLAGWFLEGVADLFSDENIEKGNLRFFVASFSRSRDDLKQWQVYADNARGFAIGFATKIFRVTEAVSPSPNENTFLGRVLYDSEQIRSRNKLTIAQGIGIFERTLRAQRSLLRDKSVGIPFMRELSLHMIAQPLIWNSLTSKHSAYEHEQEVRLSIMGISDKLAPFIKTRIRGSEKVPYITHPWNVRDADNIAEIIVGPAAPPEAEDTIRTLLATYGVAGVKIVRSEIPYRALG